MKTNKSISKILFLIVALLGIALVAYAASEKVRFLGTTQCTEPLPLEKGARVMKLCDGETKVIVAVNGVRSDGMMPRDVAQDVATMLWDKYQEMNAEKQHSDYLLLAHGKAHTKREMMIWDVELKKLVEEGYKLFHSPELGTNGVSCDMCHPDASNTHPETYPKFQTQLKKVVMLRDMINWCIENPLEGPKLDEAGEKMKALEAYMISSRKGEALDPGKH